MVWPSPRERALGGDLLGEERPRALMAQPRLEAPDAPERADPERDVGAVDAGHVRVEVERIGPAVEHGERGQQRCAEPCGRRAGVPRVDRAADARDRVVRPRPRGRELRVPVGRRDRVVVDVGDDAVGVGSRGERAVARAREPGARLAQRPARRQNPPRGRLVLGRRRGVEAARDHEHARDGILLGERSQARRDRLGRAVRAHGDVERCHRQTVVAPRRTAIAPRTYPCWRQHGPERLDHRPDPCPARVPRGHARVDRAPGRATPAPR